MHRDRGTENSKGRHKKTQEHSDTNKDTQRERQRQEVQKEKKKKKTRREKPCIGPLRQMPTNAAAA